MTTVYGEACTYVNGHWEIRLGGLVFSGLAATSFPGWWPRVLPAVGLGCQGDHPLAGEGFGEPVRVTLGQDQVGVVQQPVHGGGGEGFGMIESNPEGWILLVTATERRS